MNKGTILMTTKAERRAALAALRAAAKRQGSPLPIIHVNLSRDEEKIVAYVHPDGRVEITDKQLLDELQG